MTTIAWDGLRLAGDRKRELDTHLTRARKVYRIQNKTGVYLVGCAGDCDDCVAFLRWMEGRAEKPRPFRLTALVVDGRGRLWSVTEKLVYVRVRANLWAIGSGGDYALGAMHAGKSAADAVRIASKLDKASGFGVDVVTF